MQRILLVFLQLHHLWVFCFMSHLFDSFTSFLFSDSIVLERIFLIRFCTLNQSNAIKFILLYILFLLPFALSPTCYRNNYILLGGRERFSHGSSMEGVMWVITVLLCNCLFLSASGIALFKVFIVFLLGNELWVSKSVVTKKAFAWQKPSSQWLFLNTFWTI